MYDHTFIRAIMHHAWLCELIILYVILMTDITAFTLKTHNSTQVRD